MGRVPLVGVGPAGVAPDYVAGIQLEVMEHLDLEGCAEGSAVPCAGHKAAAPHGTGHAGTAAAQAALVQLALHAPAAVAHLAFEMSGSNPGIEAGGSGVAVAWASFSSSVVPTPAFALEAAHRHG
jgi:hypothetical protein